MYKDGDRQALIEAYLARGYMRHFMPEGTSGVVLKHPAFDQNPKEVEHTLPVAAAYALQGHLFVLKSELIDEHGQGIPSPEGFVNMEANVVEVKHATTGTPNNIKNAISAAGKGGVKIRAVWVAGKTTPETLARIINGEMRSNHGRYRLDIFYRTRL